MINNVWIINKTTGVLLFQKTYSKQKRKLDHDLFSGFITAILNFSEEITDVDESIRSISMGSIKFFHLSTETVIFVVSTDKRVNEIIIEPFMERIIGEFRIQGFDANVTSGVQEIRIFEPFAMYLDSIVFEAEQVLETLVTEEETYISEKKSSQRQRSPILKAVQAAPQPRTAEEASELQVLRDNVMEAIENAEHALTNGDIQGAIIYYGVAGGIFKRLGDAQNADLCDKMITQAKQVISSQQGKAIFTFDEEAKPILKELEPIIPINLVEDLQLRETLRLAYEAELDRNYGEAVAYYKSAENRFFELNEHQIGQKCNERILEVLKRQKLEEKAAIVAAGGDISQEEVEEFTPTLKPEPTEVELIIPENLITDDEVRAFLMNASLSESIGAYEKAISFYIEAANKFSFYEDKKNEQVCQKKIKELREKINVQQRITDIVQEDELIPLVEIPDMKIKNHLIAARELERAYKFSQAALKYNLASGMLSLKRDKKMKKYSKICTDRAKELTQLKDYVA